MKTLCSPADWICSPPSSAHVLSLMEWFHPVSLWIFILSLNFIKGSLVVNVTQSSYQAQENHNITLEWTFTSKSDSFITSLLCSLIADHKQSTLYYIYEGVEASEVQHEEFSGRVQSDKDALREGRIRLQVSRLRTEDSGLYLCEVSTGEGSGYNSCRVTVSEAKPGEAETTRHPKDLKPPDLNKDGERMPIAAIIYSLLILVGLGGAFLLKIIKKKTLNRATLHSEPQFLKNLSAREPSDLVSRLKPTAGHKQKETNFGFSWSVLY